MGPQLELDLALALGLQAKLNEYEFPVKKVANVQSQLSRLIEKNYYLNKSAREVRGSVVARFGGGAMTAVLGICLLPRILRAYL